MIFSRLLRTVLVLVLLYFQPLIIIGQKVDTLKVLSWNIHMLPGTIYHATKKVKRARLIVQELQKREDDVIVFQEAFQYRTRRILKKKLKGKFPYIYKPLNFSFFSFKTNGGVWVLSKLKLEKKAEIKFDSATGSSRWARKGAVLFEGYVGEDCFQLIGTHTNGGVVNNSQFRQIRDGLLVPFGEKKVPQLICGDLNCPKSRSIAYLKMLEILGAKDLPTNGGFTYSNHEKTDVIDYILLKSNAAEFEEWNKKIILIGNDWQVGKRKYPQTVGLSDHMPLESTYFFRKN